MFDTPIVIVGNALTAPEWRKTNTTGVLVANFRMASTSRRRDRENDRWVDGETLRVRVTCWRRLAENVGASIAVGDPIVVVGKLYTRDWTDSENNNRTSYEVEATAIGHDLARGRTRLYRNKSLVTSDAADAPDSDGVVRGERAEIVSDSPVIYGEGVPDELEPPTFDEHRTPIADPVPGLAGGGFEPFEKGGEAGRGTDGETDGAVDELEALEIEVEALQTPPRRARRSTKREPVPA